MTRLNKLLIFSNILLLLMCLFFLNKLGGVHYIVMAVTAKFQHEVRMNAHLALSMHWRSKFTTFGIPPNAIVFTGDSITRGVDWAEFFPDKKVINRAIGGINIDKLFQIVDTSFTGHQPNKIFLMIGINDLKHNMPIATFLEKYQKLVSLLKGKYSSAEIYIESLLPINQSVGRVVLGERMKNTDNEEIMDVNSKLKDLAVKNQCTFIDLYPFFIEDGVLPEKYSLDGLHLNGQAILVWKDAILRYVN